MKMIYKDCKAILIAMMLALPFVAVAQTQNQSFAIAQTQNQSFTVAQTQNQSFAIAETQNQSFTVAQTQESVAVPQTQSDTEEEIIANKRWIRSNLKPLCPKVMNFTVCAKNVVRASCEENWDSSLRAFEGAARMVLEDLTKEIQPELEVVVNGTETSIDYIASDEIQALKEGVYTPPDQRKLQKELKFLSEGNARYLRVRDEEVNDETLIVDDELFAAHNDKLLANYERLLSGSFWINKRPRPSGIKGPSMRSVYCHKCGCCNMRPGGRRTLQENDEINFNVTNTKWEGLKRKSNFYLGYLKEQCNATEFAIEYVKEFTQLINDDRITQSLPTDVLNATCFQRKNYIVVVEGVEMEIILREEINLANMSAAEASGTPH